MKLAVIQTGGKQYLVVEGSEIEIEKIKGYNQESNSKIEFNEVLFFASDDKIVFDKEELKKIKVEGVLIKKKKVKTLVWKYKPKTRYRKKKGYKKEIWLVKIEKISA
ncbi:50S ribosomal protein L21 [bacterium HR35]|nr:50S ribosomal protein L21 [bacterium HR35]